MSQVQRGFDSALSVAQLSNATRSGLRMGAALFSGPRLLALGANVYGRSHPDSNNESFSRSTHAEHVCLLKRRHYDGDRNLVLYVARRHSDGSNACSKPCANCLNLCRVAGVRRVRYFDDNGLPKEEAL